MGISYAGLWERMAKTNVSQKILEEKCGIATFTFTKMRQGYPIAMDSIIRLSEYFNCDVGDLVTRYESPQDAQRLILENKMKLLQEKIRCSLATFMKQNHVTVADVKERTSLSINTIKSVLAGGTISSGTAMKLFRLGSEYSSLLNSCENENKTSRTEDKPIITRKCCTHCPAFRSSTLENKPGVIYMDDSTQIKPGYKTTIYSCKLKYKIAVDEVGQPHPFGECSKPKTSMAMCQELMERGLVPQGVTVQAAEWESMPDSERKRLESNNEVIHILAKPATYVSLDEYKSILRCVPKGKLTRYEDIEEYLERKYKAERIEIAYEYWNYLLDKETPWWRVVSKMGMIINKNTDERQMHIKLLEEEGFTLAHCGPDGRSIKVENYKEYLFDLNSR